MPRKVPVADLELLVWPDRIRAIRGRESQREFAERTGFSLRQVKRWEQGSMPAGDSAFDLAESTGYPIRLFRPPAEPSLSELGEKLDLILSLLQSPNGRRR
jgi:transcriptional regulator with XRE-family HTH domain